MPSETFYCPHCNRQLTKSAQAYVLGESMSRKSGFIAMGNMPSDVICPGCRGRINAMKMIKGDYDFNSEDGWATLMVLVIIAAVLVLKFVLYWSWVASIIVGIAGGAMLVLILSSLFGKKKQTGLYQ